MRSKKSAGKRISPVVLTIGHSTRSIEEFIRLLQAHEVTCLADVRTIPRSRHNPQFNADSLPASLKTAGIRYVHIAELGGLRHTTRDSINGGWRNTSFRGFADYMQTPEFAEAIDRLIELARHERIAIMCAEAVPWRCHRSLISDALLIRGIRVEHIMSLTHRQAHALTPFAKVRGMQITYPPEKSGGAEKPRRKTSPARSRAVQTKQKPVLPKKHSAKPRKRKSADLPVSV
ncbi:MAG TPA: DUF488 domain-containing protein [Verrucomicrobiae bacterium]|nr:DUF488 domain-containing protein [Verrucomicrobiae bacterium]